MSAFDFLFAPSASPFMASSSLYLSDPRNRRDAAMLAMGLPNAAGPAQVPMEPAASGPPTPMVPPQGPVGPPPAPPPGPPQQQQVDPNGFPQLPEWYQKYDAMIPQDLKEVPSGLGRYFETRNPMDLFDSSGYRAKQFATRLNMIKMLQELDKGDQHEFGNSGIIYRGDNPQESNWSNFQRYNDIAATGNGSRMHDFSAAQPVRSSDGEWGTYRVDSKTGVGTVVDSHGNVVKDTSKWNSVGVDGKIQEFNVKQNSEYAKALQEASSAAQSTYQLAERMRGLKTGGPGAVQSLYRMMAEASGMDVGGVDLSDLQTQKNILANWEIYAAAPFKGTGPITEGERAIIRRSIPLIGSDPKALQEAIGAMESIANKTQDIAAAYDTYRSVMGQGADPYKFGADVSRFWRDALAEAGPNGDGTRTKAWSSFLSQYGVANHYNSSPASAGQTPAQSPQGNAPAAPPSSPASQRRTPTVTMPDGSVKTFGIQSGNKPPPGGPSGFAKGLQLGTGGYGAQPTPAAPPPPTRPPVNFKPPAEGGPMGMPAPPGYANPQWAPRDASEGVSDVYSTPYANANAPGPSALLATPQDRLIAASRGSDRGKAFNETASQAMNLAKLLKELPKMSPQQRAKVLADLKARGLIQ